VGGHVTAVSSSATHTFSKPNRDGIRLLTGLGVEGDAHLGVTVKHRSRVARDPSQPKGEKVTTRGVDLLALPTGTRLYLGATAVLAVELPSAPHRPLAPV